MKTAPVSRRKFLKHSALGASALWLAVPFRSWGEVSPNEKLNIGFIGVGGQAEFSISNLVSHNIAALCDVDDVRLDKAAVRFPQAKKYNDFRRLIDQKGLDAIVVATPDHTHAVADVAALKSGRHLYSEKPLSRTISEARIITETARKQNLVTQIGTQIHAGTNYRRTVELIQSGVIGKVAEVHVWVNATYGGKERPKDTPPVPPNIHYELWLGPVDYRPYSSEYLPFVWRHWWAFGGGALADFGCHYMDLPHWALELRSPLTAEVLDGPPVHAESPPPWLVVKYQYPARGEKPPLGLTWYHGGKQPPPEVLSPDLALNWKSGVLFIGEKGMVLADYGRVVLLPEKDFAGFVPPKPFIKDSIGHHNEWVQAIKTGGTTTCPFDYSGPLTEAALLGNVAFRVGEKIQWDAKNLRAKSCPQADKFIHHHYRAGWKI